MEIEPPMELGELDVEADGLSLLTVGEAARLLAITEPAVRRHIAQGRLSAYRIGEGPKARIRIPSSSLAEYLRETSRPTVETR